MRTVRTAVVDGAQHTCQASPISIKDREQRTERDFIHCHAALGHFRIHGLNELLSSQRAAAKERNQNAPTARMN